MIVQNHWPTLNFNILMQMNTSKIMRYLRRLENFTFHTILHILHFHFEAETSYERMRLECRDRGLILVFKV